MMAPTHYGSATDGVFYTSGNFNPNVPAGERTDILQRLRYPGWYSCRRFPSYLEGNDRDDSYAEVRGPFETEELATTDAQNIA